MDGILATLRGLSQWQTVLASLVGVSAVTALSLFKRSAAILAVWDGITRKRPLEHLRLLAESVEVDSPYRRALEQRQRSEAFRQAFGFSGSAETEASAIELYLAGRCSPRELRAFFAHFRLASDAEVTREALGVVRVDAAISIFQLVLLVGGAVFVGLATNLTGATRGEQLVLALVALAAVAAWLRTLTDLARALIALRIARRLGLVPPKSA